MSQSSKEKEKRLNALDEFWCRAETPSNPIIISILLEFNDELDLYLAKKILQERLLSHSRFTSFPRGKKWVKAQHFRLEDHLHVIHLENEEFLQPFINSKMNQCLPSNKPLWEAFLIRRTRGRDSIFIRLHHAIADGLSLVELALSLTDPVNGDQIQNQIIGPSQKRTVLHQLSKFSFSTLQKILFVPDDPITPLKEEFNKENWGVRIHSIPLDDIKLVSKHLKVTLNDVLMGVFSGALRKYLVKHTKNLRIKAMVPFNLRAFQGLQYHSTKDIPLFNDFSILFLPLATFIEGSEQRIHFIHSMMCDLKESPQVVINVGIMKLLGLLPRKVVQGFINHNDKKASIFFTNVPGPREKRKFAGKVVENASFWIPHSSKMGISASLFSYAGKVSLGLAGDRRIPLAEILVDFETELNRLIEEAKNATALTVLNVRTEPITNKQQ